MANSRRITWYEQQRRRKLSKFYQLLDRSFKTRLLLSGAIALLLLGIVNRFEHCNSKEFAPGCQYEEGLAVISIGNVESFSIVTAAIMYILEGRRRKQREHRDAMDSIISANGASAVVSLARIQGLESLSEDGIWLDGLDLSGTNLEQLEVPQGRLRKVNFSNADLTGTDMHEADLQQASFVDANLTNANLSDAVLTEASFQGAKLSGTNLRNADLSSADLTGANLTQTNLVGANTTRTKFDEGTTLSLY